MAIDQATVLRAIVAVVADVAGIERVYGEAEEGDDALPLGAIETPAVLVMTGRDVDYLLRQGQHRHTYAVRLLVLAGGADLGETAANVLPVRNRIIAAFAEQVTLAATVTYCAYRPAPAGIVTIEWSGVEYVGHELELHISEQANITPTTGS
jgi:hypothetical protein